jgi:hypothetical protein
VNFYSNATSSGELMQIQVSNSSSDSNRYDEINDGVDAIIDVNKVGYSRVLNSLQ